MAFVSIIMGSKSDYDVMKNCAETLEKFGIAYEIWYQVHIEVPIELTITSKRRKQKVQKYSYVPQVWRRTLLVW